MSTIKVIITGATGMVGEGVLFECLQNEKVSDVLIVSRRHYDLHHPKLKELIVSDFHLCIRRRHRQQRKRQNNVGTRKRQNRK